MTLNYDFLMGLSEAYSIGSNASWILSEGECVMSISFLFCRSETSYMDKLFYKFHYILCCDS